MSKDFKKSVILFNCSTNNIGGGMKNSALFIIKSLNSEDTIKWVYAISTEVAEILESKNIKIDHRFYIFKESPAKSKSSQKKLRSLAVTSKSNLVYTMAGPAYVKFPIYHVQGLSSAYITHVGLDVFKINKSIISNIKLVLKIVFQLFKSKNADYFIFQTEAARNIYCKRALIKKDKTSVISNAFDSEMQKNLSKLETSKTEKKKVFKIFCPGAAYEHKAFQFIPKIAKELIQINTKFEFILTLPDSSLLQQINKEAEELKIAKHIVNHGPYDYSNITALYSMADIVFVPSLLETFSATYLEAMIANKILLVSDKNFAKEVCGDAAFYIDPLNPTNTAKVLSSIIENPENYKPDSKRRKVILEKYGDHQDRFDRITKLLLSLNEN